MSPPGILEADLGIPSVSAFTTLRAGGVSRGAYESFNLASHVGDSSDAVTENRRRLTALIGASKSVAWLSQVHGSRVVPAHSISEPVEADGAWTDRSHVVCAVMTADCLPVVVADTTGGVVGVAHAGWRGLAAGILTRLVQSLPAPVGGLNAWLGPAIGPSAFEVGPEIQPLFINSLGSEATSCFQSVSGVRQRADLYGLARLELARLGVNVVTGGERCTFSEPSQFFSHRRDGVTGRMATVVMRAS